jgi:hypothetical protein
MLYHLSHEDGIQRLLRDDLVLEISQQQPCDGTSRRTRELHEAGIPVCVMETQK